MSSSLTLYIVTHCLKTDKQSNSWVRGETVVENAQSPGLNLLSPIERMRDNRPLNVQKMMGERNRETGAQVQGLG